MTGGRTWLDVALAALNVFQTLVLAWLARLHVRPPGGRRHPQ
jgi:hypothetical protein